MPEWAENFIEWTTAIAIIFAFLGCWCNLIWALRLVFTPTGFWADFWTVVSAVLFFIGGIFALSFLLSFAGFRDLISRCTCRKKQGDVMFKNLCVFYDTRFKIKEDGDVVWQVNPIRAANRIRATGSAGL